MADVLENAITSAQDAVAKQGDTVRSLKASLKEGKLEKVRACDIGRSSETAISRSRPAPTPARPPWPQSAVDEAIKKLAALKVELDAAQKAS
jgi:hypothetical protein